MRQIESLESRQLLSAVPTMVRVVLRAGNLAIIGTPRSDAIEIGSRTDADGVPQIDVAASGLSTKTYPANLVRRVVVLGGFGDDQIDATGDSTAFTDNLPDDTTLGVPLVAIGGPGNDRIAGSSQNDVINGGPGNDNLFGSSGNDLLLGAAGNDSISGGEGQDRIAGGPGFNSLLTTEIDNREVFGRHKFDYVYRPTSSGLTLVSGGTLNSNYPTGVSGSNGSYVHSGGTMSGVTATGFNPATDVEVTTLNISSSSGSMTYGGSGSVTTSGGTLSLSGSNTYGMPSGSTTIATEINAGTLTISSSAFNSYPASLQALFPTYDIFLTTTGAPYSPSSPEVPVVITVDAEHTWAIPSNVQLDSILANVTYEKLAYLPGSDSPELKSYDSDETIPTGATSIVPGTNALLVIDTTARVIMSQRTVPNG